MKKNALILIMIFSSLTTASGIASAEFGLPSPGTVIKYEGPKNRFIESLYKSYPVRIVSNEQLAERNIRIESNKIGKGYEIRTSTNAKTGEYEYYLWNQEEIMGVELDIILVERKKGFNFFRD